MDIIYREIQQELEETASQYPVVTLVGPRQSGKTTVARLVFSNYRYCSLENPDLRRYAQQDPRSFLDDYSDNVIFDEIQRVPELLSYLQEIVDTNQKAGQFILTGSHQLKLRADISQSLAGRTAILNLLPFSWKELKQNSKLTSKEELLYYGLFPWIYHDELNPTKAYANYYQTYVERDVRQLIQLKNLYLFEKFLKLLAGRVGQLLNANSLANDVGVSCVTINEWISVLEASFIIVKLNPYFENFGKRVIKSSKIYFIDTGLLCYLLDIDDPKILRTHPLIGNIFENYVILEAMKARYNKGLPANLYFFRDNTGNEIDILFKHQNELIPIEVKSASTFSHHFAKGIDFFQKIAPNASKGYIIYDGNLLPKKQSWESLNFRDTHRIFD
ncbi:MAG: ATP-binding protein [bacterium]